MTFSEKELSDIDAALCVAASVYRDDAQLMRNSNQSRLAEQFEEQERKIRALMEKIGKRNC